MASVSAPAVVCTEDGERGVQCYSRPARRRNDAETRAAIADGDITTEQHFEAAMDTHRSSHVPWYAEALVDDDLRFVPATI